MASYLGNNPDNIIKVRKANYRYVATAGQTVFSGSDSNSLTMQVNTSDVEVFLNGVLLDQTDYTATISSITLTSGATVGDILEIITNTEFQVSSLYTKEEVDLKVSVKADTTTVNSALALKANTSSLATVATSGSYNDLTNKPAITPTAISDQANSSTGYLDLPAGTTAQRPVTPSTGMCRFNTTTNYYEFYDGTAWVNLALPYNIDYLAIAGGGSGGNGFSNTTGTTGGGGAGGYVTGAGVLLTPGQSYTITIGAGGSGVIQSSGSSTFGNYGNNTTISGTSIAVTAIRGGRGGYDTGGSADLSGGSGGGAGSNSTAGSGTAGQGYAGGAPGSGAGGGGGGGAAAAGAQGYYNNSGGYSGAGGSGATWLDGVTRAGGGGGGGFYGTAVGTPGAGGSGGGTAGGVAHASGGTYGLPGVGTVSSNHATANTGSGSGGGGSQDSTGAASGSGNGGSGVVIIRYAGSQRGTGGTVTSSGGYTYHTFTTSGVYTA